MSSADDMMKQASQLHAQTRAAYQAVEAKLADQLRQVRAVLSALGVANEAIADQPEDAPRSGAVPPIYQIRLYLQECGKPMSQADIVREVGDKRAAEYPHLTRPYGDVWKSLEYHDRHNREIVCVRMEGDKIVRAQLVPKPRNPRVKGGAGDRPEFYAGDNLFYFLAEVDNVVE